MDERCHRQRECRVGYQTLQYVKPGMPVTKVGAIFATSSKLLQRVYIPDADDSEIAQQFVGAGETLLNVPVATYRTGGPVAVQAVIGVPTFSGWCAVVAPDTHLVVAVIIADPALYTDTRGSVIAHDHVRVGDAWTGAVFTRRYVEINPHAPTALTAVVAVSFQDITNPTPITPGNIMMASDTLNVGSAIAPSQFLKFKAFP